MVVAGLGTTWLANTTKALLRLLALAGVLGLFAGCTAKREAYMAPDVPVPRQFRQSIAPAAADPLPLPTPRAEAEEALGANVRFVDEMLAEWWRVLGNKELDALMDQALANNADLRVATLRMAQAKARAEQAKADSLPLVTAPYEARIEAPASGVASGRPGVEVASRHLYQGSLRADWRLDVWGERAAAADSAQMQLWRSIYQRDDTRRLTAASVTSQYIEYLSLNDRLRVARETEVVLRGMLDSVAGRLKGGDATITELEQQRAAVYAVQATIPALELQRENAINAIALLLGATPGSLALSQRGMDSLTFPRVLPGVPANLLLRRPDVRAIEARLLSADADIDVARTRLLPAIDLTSQIGYGSLVFSRLFQPYNLAWNTIAGVTATIFDYGKRTNEVLFARAFHEELVETYVRVLYSAIKETEDSIAAVQMNSKRLDSQGAAVRAAKRAWDLSYEAYREGAIDYLVLLDTERTYHRNLDEYHRISMDRHKGLIAMFSALGGGVPRDSPEPSRGDPQNAVVRGDALSQAAARSTPVQFLPHALESDRPYWLVELAGLQDRVGVTHVWRDLMNRFPDLMSDRIMLPRLQGRVASETQERASWYRLFVAKFTNANGAKEFCDRLSAALIRCRPIPSNSPAYQEDAIENQVADQTRPSEIATAAAKPPVVPAASQAQRVSSQTARAAAVAPQPLRTTAEVPVPAPAREPVRARPRPAEPTHEAIPLPVVPRSTVNTEVLQEMPATKAPPLIAEPRPATQTRIATETPATRPSTRVPDAHAISPTSSGSVATNRNPELAVTIALAKPPAERAAVRPPERREARTEPAAPEKTAEGSRLAYAVQLVTTPNEADAVAASRKWSRKGFQTYIYPVLNAKGEVLFAVRTGVYADMREASAQAAVIRRDEQVFAVRVPVLLDEAGKPASAVRPEQIANQARPNQVQPSRD